MQRTGELAGSTRIPRAEHRSHDVGGNAASEGPSSVRARVLVVEDEAVYGRCLLRTIERCGGAATLVGTVREAREQLASGGPWTGLIVDVRLPDGSGLDVLREARATGVQVPALIVTGLRDNALAHAAFELGATYLVKPVEDIYVESLVHHATEECARISRLVNVVATWTARYLLSEAESDVLLLAAKGHDRAAIAIIRCSSEATIKNHIHNLLRKTGDLSLRDAVKRLLTDAQ
jgi:DNA-binding NarL/FixJ family response regulator